MTSPFELGTTLVSMTAIDELTTPLPDMKSNYFPYSRVVGLGSGGVRGVGAPYATWTFPILEIDAYNQLRVFCPGAMAAVYVHTKLDDDTFAVFSGNMIVPLVAQDRNNGMRKNVTVEFRNLVLVEGS